MGAAEDSQPLRETWLGRALESAGIDPATWSPQDGLEPNRHTVEAVYDYYGRLFLDHAQLKWAGMAGMLGPTLYAGFRDLGLLPDAGRRTVGDLFGRGSRKLAELVAGDLGFYETTFLTMQKKIFEDLAPMHEAYIAGGVAEIEKLYEAAILDATTLDAWRAIDAGHRGGDAALVDQGTHALLMREQRDIIDRFYVSMLRHRGAQGSLFTYLLTLVGVPSVPGAKGYAEAYPLGFSVRVWRATVTARTPLADGNVAVFANRWKLIEADTLPDYLRFLRDRQAEVRAMLATPVSARTPAFRVSARLGRLAAGAVSGWDLEIAAPTTGGREGPPLVGGSRVGLAMASAKPVRAARTGGAAIDLSDPPTRRSAGLEPGSDSRVWMNKPGATFDVTVTLPAGRVYRTRAELALMMSSRPGGDPDHLTVRLAPLDLEGARQLLIGYAADWGIPAQAVSGWREGAERGRADGLEYCTHVLSGAEVGFAQVEFQISHHVREGVFVVAALFILRRAGPSATRVAAQAGPTGQDVVALQGRGSPQAPRPR